MDYEQLTVDELHQRLKGKGVGAMWDMHKAELVEALEEIESGNGPGRMGASRNGSGNGSVQELEPGKSDTIRDHGAIRAWAEARGARPATVPGTEHDGHLGVLRFDFPGYGGEDLQQVSWDEWFDAFDQRNVEFLYQDRKKDGNQSNFFRLLSADHAGG
jgi:hypothetical protein